MCVCWGGVVISPSLYLQPLSGAPLKEQSVVPCSGAQNLESQTLHGGTIYVYFDCSQWPLFC